MNTGRSSRPLEDEELRLPRTPGLIRRFWARHPTLADVLIALACFVMSAAPVTVFRTYTTPLEDPGDPGPIPLATAIIIVAAVAITCVLLLRRRQWPRIVFAAGWATTFIYLLSGEPSGGILLLMVSYALAVYRSTRAAWLGFACGMVPYTLVCTLLSMLGVFSLQSAVNGVIGQFVIALIGTLIGTNVGGRKRYVEAIIDRSRQLLTERDQQAQIAAASERARIAREMHDIVSHSLTVVVALSEGAAATDDRQRARDASTAAATTARGALTEMRAMLGVLRDGDTDAPLAPAEPVSPQQTIAAAQHAGYPATLTTTGSDAASPVVRFAVGRIVQEGMTNAMRHASGARSIAVRIDHTADTVTIQIDNDGVTQRVGTSGYGIRGLQERAAHVGGSLSSGPAGPGRWILRAELPANEHRGEDEHE
ncbi:sensor histidine kinase [Microbacterium sp. A94]|uniref:sensor histidine kinase n=1 Tax=Microbacterium sp. A94 TaxID=3450717 RepID=UPI003F4323A1